jgi:hypothetical protein
MTSGNIYAHNSRNSTTPFQFEDIAGGSPLPIELVSFSAKQEGEKTNLSWQTKTEVHNYGFEVERSIDSKGWNKIGFVEGCGNSNSTKNYSFVENNPKGGSISN